MLSGSIAANFIAATLISDTSYYLIDEKILKKNTSNTKIFVAIKIYLIVS